MKKWKTTLYIVLFITAVIIVAAAIRSEFGYVLVSIGTWTYEGSLSNTILLNLVLYVALAVVIWVGLRIWNFPISLRNYRDQRSAERARRNINQGLIELLEGHWQKAEHILINNVENSDTPLLNYLLAARAAQQLDANERRDEYLKQAHDKEPKADIAVGLTQAELQLAHGQSEQALATLSRLREIAPKHPYVLKMLSRLYAQVNEWEKLAELLPELRKRRIVTGEKLLSLERNTYTQFLRYVARSKMVLSLEEQWRLLPKQYRNDKKIFRVYIDCLIDTDNGVAAERALRQFLNKTWDEKLVKRYGELNLSQAALQLEHAETWLKEHGRSPMLLLTLARLCQQLRLWGKARVYYETSIAVHPSAEAYAELSELLESLNESSSAYDCLRKGMALTLSGGQQRRADDKAFLRAKTENGGNVFIGSKSTGKNGNKVAATG